MDKTELSIKPKHNSIHTLRFIPGWLKYVLQLGFGLALFGLIIYLGDLNYLYQLTDLRWWPLLGAFITTLVISGALTSRWGVITDALAGRRVASWYEYFYYSIISRFLGFVVPKDLTDLGGRTAALYHYHNLPFATAGEAVLLDRLFDVLSMALFLPPALFYWLGWINAPVAIGLMLGTSIIVSGLLFIGHRWMVTGVTFLLHRSLQLVHNRPWLRNPLSKLVNIVRLNRKVILLAYLYSLIKFSCTAGRMVFFTLALNLPISPMLILLGTPIGQLSYLFAFTPGGLGIFEAGWFTILVGKGAPAEYVMNFVIGQRILTVTLVAVVTFFSQLWYMRKQYLAWLPRFNSNVQE